MHEKKYEKGAVLYTAESRSRYENPEKFKTKASKPWLGLANEKCYNGIKYKEACFILIMKNVKIITTCE